jgi:hypothetical protein
VTSRKRSATSPSRHQVGTVTPPTSWSPTLLTPGRRHYFGVSKKGTSYSILVFRIWHSGRPKSAERRVGHRSQTLRRPLRISDGAVRDRAAAGAHSVVRPGPRRARRRDDHLRRLLIWWTQRPRTVASGSLRRDLGPVPAGLLVAAVLPRVVHRRLPCVLQRLSTDGSDIAAGSRRADGALSASKAAQAGRIQRTKRQGSSNRSNSRAPAPPSPSAG